MLAGHLREKNGYYQMILSYKDSNGKRKTKSISTGLPVKGNKKRAEAMLLEARKTYKPDDVLSAEATPYHDILQQWLSNTAIKDLDDDTYAIYAHNMRVYIAEHFKDLGVSLSAVKTSTLEAYYNHLKRDGASKKTILQLHEMITASLDYAVSEGLIASNPAKGINPATNEVSVLFTDFLLEWLEMMKPGIAATTYSSYSCNIKESIVPYFIGMNLTLTDIEANPKYIQDYYQAELAKGLSSTTVLRRHANIRKALQHAYKLDLIKSNPADKVEKPKTADYSVSYYNADEISKLLDYSKGDPLELPIILAAYYGLRRSEILGLKWSAVDFIGNTLTIRYTVTEVSLGTGKGNVIVERESTKTKSSKRTLPLVKPVRDILERIRDEQEDNRRLCGSSYNADYLDFICVNAVGDRIKPNYITQHFQLILTRHDLGKIRFHDLRHSCASLLYANGISLKEIQQWLGHSNISTTANIYTHLDYSSKLNTANAILSVLSPLQEKV